jgi:hypothetical protein
MTFTVKPPVVTLLTPAAGAIGIPVTITGRAFGPTQGTSTVTFNGVTASVSKWSNASITCAVPAGATTGPVVVTTPVASSPGKTFTLKPPVIDLLTPAAGAIGAVVTITGRHFGTSQGSSTVTFNGTTASVITKWVNGTIKCTVPSGATTGPVVVTTPVGASPGKAFRVK